MFSDILWIAGAAILGFLISSIFAGLLRLPRNIYLMVYIPLGGAGFAGFLLFQDLDLSRVISHNWYWGLLAAAIATLFVVRNVLSQPSSKRSKGGKLVLDILWPGFTYGLVDSLLLSVLPVMAIDSILPGATMTYNPLEKLGFGALALIASIFVTALYHLGYPEFRNKNLFWTFLGNGILTLAYIITMNPLAAIIPHIIMHITAIIHGKETTGQVPPHYS